MLGKLVTGEVSVGEISGWGKLVTGEISGWGSCDCVNCFGKVALGK